MARLLTRRSESKPSDPDLAGGGFKAVQLWSNQKAVRCRVCAYVLEM